MTRIAPYLIAALALALSACTNPYDPVQRGLGGGLLGAASGAAIGAAAGGGPGAALGAAIGGATGIFGGVASTPPLPPGTYFGYPAYGYPAYGYPGYAQPGYGDTQATQGTLLTPDPRPMDRQATRDIPPTLVLRAMDYQATRASPLTRVHRAMDTRADRCTLPTPGPVMDTPWLAIPAIAPRRTGRLEPSTLLSLLAEFRPKLHLQSSPLVRGEGKRFRKIALPAEKGRRSTAAAARGPQPCQRPRSGVGSFTLAASPSRRNLAVRPVKSGMPGEFPE
jgi:hypothetical protein